jgi:hypothetical protein
MGQVKLHISLFLNLSSGYFSMKQANLEFGNELE